MSRSVLEEAVRSIQDKRYFAREILGADLWWQQEEILDAVFAHRDVAVKSCHASGKTYVAAVVALAWVRLHASGTAMVVITSTDWRQVEKQVFPHIQRMAAQAKWDFGKGFNQVEVTMPGGNQILGISTNNLLAFHGFHAEHILVIRDEFSGIDESIVNSMAGMRAGGHVAFLDLMNPVMSSGPSVDRFEDPKVHKITVDGLNTPNMDGFHIYETPEENDADPDKEHNLLFLDDSPGGPLDQGPRSTTLISRRFIREMYEDAIRKHGSLKPESDWWPKVRGQFPEASDSMLIQRGWINAANTRVVERQDYDVCGLDVAGPGEDETAACLRSGMKVLREMAWAGEINTLTVEAWIGPPRDDLWINIDRQGIGWGMFDELRRKGYQIVGLNAGDSAYDKSRYDHAKGEMYWNLRLHFQKGSIGGPIDELTRHQLANIKWDQDNPQRLIHIESKKEARKRGVRSPDRAEAMILAFAATPQRTEPRDWRYQDTSQAPAKRGEKWKRAMRAARVKAGLVSA